MEKGARDGKACGAMAFALNFLWLLSLFQDKESDKYKINESCHFMHHYHYSIVVGENTNTNHGVKAATSYTPMLDKNTTT